MREKNVSREAASAGNEGDILSLPRHAADQLKWDTACVTSFQDDLQMFGRKFGLHVELRGLDAVVVRPTGFVQQEAIQEAQVELQGLIGYHFPAAAAEPERRWVVLRVHPEYGAGIEIAHSVHGYRVDAVENFPGQDFFAGEVIVEINGTPLGSLSEEGMEEAFGECFGDGASLCLIRSPEQ